MAAFFVFLTVILILVSLSLWSQWSRAKRIEFIRTYSFPPGLFAKLSAHRPGLSKKNLQLVSRGLRQFFLAHAQSGGKHVSMPSQVVDDLWHEFILYTRQYDEFCTKAFGKFLHHTPAVVLSADKQNNSGLRRVWWYTCKEENIDPRAPTRLPLLFALDQKLKIENGFHYTTDCAALRKSDGATSTPHCGGDFSSSSFDGTTDGMGDADSGGGDGGDGGGGCGGD